jgi:hypothetical protein
MSRLIKIPIDEIDAEMDYEGWINFKSKVMAAMLNGTVGWDEGCAMRNLIDHALSSAAGKQAKEQYMDNLGRELSEDRSTSNIQKVN